MRKSLLFLLCISAFLPIISLRAYEAVSTYVPDKQEIVKAKVIKIEHQQTEVVEGTDVTSNVQKLSVLILEGAEKDKIVTITNDYLTLSEGQLFYMVHTTRVQDGIEMYAIQEPYRLKAVLFFVALFIVCVCMFGGKQGIRGLISLIGSLALIIYVMLPAILHGYSPILVTIGIASLIIVLGSYITHGLSKTTTSAVIGMIVTVLFTGVLSYAAVHYAQLSGFSSEESVYLNFNTKGLIDFKGLLFGGIVIGLLGILYDIAIGQAIAVEELARVAPHLGRRTIYTHALRIGREHIGALVNTLAIAYVGVSLPLLLLFTSSASESIAVTINRELFSTEIIRTMIGSIGLIIAVPITTFLSVFFLITPRSRNIDPNVRQIEEEKLLHAGHHH